MSRLSRGKRQKLAKCQFKTRNLNTCHRCKERFLCLTEKISLAELNIPSWLFKVPNNEEGRKFLAQLTKYKNKDLIVFRKRGRAKDRRAKGGNQHHQPVATAEWFAVYAKGTWLAENVRQSKRLSRGFDHTDPLDRYVGI